MSDQTVRRWIKAGKLVAYKPGKEYRVSEGDLEQFLASRRSEVPKAQRPEQRSSESQAGRSAGQNLPETPTEQKRVEELEETAEHVARLFLRWQEIRRDGYTDSQAAPGVRVLEIRNAARWALQEAGNNARRIKPRSEVEREATNLLYEVLEVGLESARQFEHDEHRLLTEASELHDAGKRDITRLLEGAEQAQRADV